MMAVMGSSGCETYSVKDKLLPEKGWKMTACWRSSVRDGRVSAWRTYTNNKPIYDIMAKTQVSDLNVEIERDICGFERNTYAGEPARHYQRSLEQVE